MVNFEEFKKDFIKDNPYYDEDISLKKELENFYKEFIDFKSVEDIVTNSLSRLDNIEVKSKIQTKSDEEIQTYLDRFNKNEETLKALEDRNAK